MEIIPVINCPNIVCVSERVGRAKEFSKWVHLDVSDARFTFGKSWGDASVWEKISEGINTEVHLMVEEPEKAVGAWLNAGAKRLIVHVETIEPRIEHSDILENVGMSSSKSSFEEIQKACEAYNAELMLAISPETPVEKLKPYFGKVLEFQVLAVHAGPAGQNFLPLVLDKIRFLRKELPDATIEVDGGINLETARQAKDAGADIVTAATYIFKSDNPSARYDELRRV